MSVDVRGSVPAGAIDAVFDWFVIVDDIFSTWRSDSEISRLGRGELRASEASRALQDVLELCDELRSWTWGAFDITVALDPRVERWEGLGAVDASGMVKGWALDRAGVMLRTAGADRFTINAGGDVLVAGSPDGEEPWRVGIQHPWQRDAVACSVAVTDVGVATSGRYERGDHVLDPRSGRPATSIMAATVVLPTLAEADALATALVALGEDAAAWLEAHPDVAAFLIGADGTVLSTAPFEEVRIRDA